MKGAADYHRPFGTTGLRLPPLVFGTGDLANARRVIPAQTKIELCGEWFEHVAPPVAIRTVLDENNGAALEVLVRIFQQLEISPDEVLIMHGLNPMQFSNSSARAAWTSACRLLGPDYRPQLAAIEYPDELLAAAPSPEERNRRFQGVVDAIRLLAEHKAKRQLAGVGVTVRDWRVVDEIESSVELDWIMLVGCLTILRHPQELLQFMKERATRQIPLIISGVFDCDFLLGGSTFDSRMLRPENPADQSLFAWRKAFTALCHGHGVTPARACIEFALSAPGVAAVVINTSRPERVAENVAAATHEAPDAFWVAMREERLLA